MLNNSYVNSYSENCPIIVLPKRVALVKCKKLISTYNFVNGYPVLVHLLLQKVLRKCHKNVLRHPNFPPHTQRMHRKLTILFHKKYGTGVICTEGSTRPLPKFDELNYIHNNVYQFAVKSLRSRILTPTYVSKWSNERGPDYLPKMFKGVWCRSCIDVVLKENINKLDRKTTHVIVIITDLCL